MTSNNVPSLLDMCITKTCSFLREGNRRLDENEQVENPFAHLPSRIVDKLLERALNMKMNGSSRVDMLRPLLMSGRVTEIEIDCCWISREDEIEVLRILSHYASGIRKVTVSFAISGEWLLQTDPIGIVFCDFISRCSNLQHLSCTENFNMDSMDRYPKLSFLEVPLETIENFLPKQTNENSKPCYNLTHVHMLEYCSRDVAMKLLQWCPNLIALENDIAEALEALHGKDYAEGNLNKTYSLQKYVLGTNGSAAVEECAKNLLQNDVAVRIAALTCPSTTDVLVWTGEHTSLAALANFKNLDSLKVEWDFSSFADSHPALGRTLQTIGNGLRTLHIHRFEEVDFAAIDKCCPNLEELSASYQHSQGIRDPSTGAFSKLRKLCLYCDGVKPEDLQFLLSNCMELRQLDVATVPCLTNELLAIIMRKNKFSYLEKVSFGSSSLTGGGFQTFVRNCPLLDEAMLGSRDFKSRETERILHEINRALHFPLEKFFNDLRG